MLQINVAVKGDSKEQSFDLEVRCICRDQFNLLSILRFKQSKCQLYSHTFSFMMYWWSVFFPCSLQALLKFIKQCKTLHSYTSCGFEMPESARKGTIRHGAQCGQQHSVFNMLYYAYVYKTVSR